VPSLDAGGIHQFGHAVFAAGLSRIAQIAIHARLARTFHRWPGG
jgi:hypothetical protein